MRIIGILLLIFSISAPLHANEKVFRVDISKCSSKPCNNVIMKKYKVGKDIRVLAWANIVDAFHEGFPSFYPLFDIYNRSSKPINILIGMRLLDKHKEVLAKRMLKTRFSVYDPNASKYKIYRSLKAVKLTKDVINKTKYVSIIVGK